MARSIHQPGAVAVFGSSEPLPGEPLYRDAKTLGRLLAEAGRTVITGGYGGVMEAASRGAFEAQGTTIGVTCRIFDDRNPNPYLTQRLATADLHERTQKLIGLSGGFVVMAGKAGTLAELCFLWALHRAGTLGERPVVLLGGRWGTLLQALAQCSILDPPQFELNRVVDDPAEAVRALGPSSKA